MTASTLVGVPKRYATAALLVALIAGLAWLAAPRASAQSVFVTRGPGSQIGVTVADVDATDREPRGVRIERVRPDSPAEAAGLRTNDIVVEFDGERVRSARQFSRLVAETPPGRQVSTVVVRDADRITLSITPVAGRSADVFIQPDRLRERFGELRQRVPFEFDFDFDPPGFAAPARLGVTVQEMTPELASYFGAKDGVLVSSVTPDSPADRAGLMAGDVITAVAGASVGSRNTLVRELRDRSGEVQIEIVRDRKARTVTVTLEPPQSWRRPAPVI